MTRPPWWRPFARRRWDRAERARLAALPCTTTVTFNEICAPFVDQIVAYQYEPNAVAFYFKPKSGAMPKADVTLTAMEIGFAHDKDGES